jgi:hypothetical protein
MQELLTSLAAITYIYAWLASSGILLFKSLARTVKTKKYVMELAAYLVLSQLHTILALTTAWSMGR